MPTSSVRGSPAKGKANGPPAQLIQEWLGNRIAFIVSEPLIVEVEHTFESPYFTRKVTPENGVMRLPCFASIRVSSPSIGTCRALPPIPKMT